MYTIPPILVPTSMQVTRSGDLACIVTGAGVLLGVGDIHPGAGESVSATAGAAIMAGVVSIPAGAVPSAGQVTTAVTGATLTMAGAATTVVAAGDILLT